MGGDLMQAESLKEQDRVRQISMDDLVNSSRKRKSSEDELMGGRAVLPDVYPGGTRAALSDVHPINFHMKPEHEKISIICKALREEDGKLWHLWNDPDFLPYLIMHYQGFAAYAMSLA
jgi:hypothetical protein